MVKINPMPSVSALREEYNIARRVFLMARNSNDIALKNDNKVKTEERSRMDYLPKEVVNITREELEPFVNGRRMGNYLLGRTIGEGSFAKVKEALHICTGEKVAVKVIDKRRAQQDRYVSRNLRREARILGLVHHPNVIQLLEVMETERFYYIVTEFCRGGDFLDYICDRKYLDEETTKKYVRQLVSAIWCLHSLGVVHRDLKIENFLLDEDGNLKIVDFGLSNVMPASAIDTFKKTGVHVQLLTTHCGSPAYAAPELLAQRRYGPQVDVWSIGVNMYAMLTGTLPYVMEPFSIMDMYSKMMKRQMSPIPKNLSEDCKDLLQRFLEPSPEKRISLENAARHPWLASYEWHTNLHNSISSSTLPGVDNLNESILLHIRDKVGLRMRDVILALSEGKAVNASVVYRLLELRLKRFKKRNAKQGLKFEPIKFDKIEIIKKAKVFTGSLPKNEKPKFVYKGVKIGSKKSKSQPSILIENEDSYADRDCGQVGLLRSGSEETKENYYACLSARRLSNPDSYGANRCIDDPGISQEDIYLRPGVCSENVSPPLSTERLKSQSDSTRAEFDMLGERLTSDSDKEGTRDSCSPSDGTERKKKRLCRSYSDGAESKPLVKTMKVLAKKPLQHSQFVSVPTRTRPSSENAAVHHWKPTADYSEVDPSTSNGIVGYSAEEELKGLVGALEGLARNSEGDQDETRDVVIKTSKIPIKETRTVVVPSPVKEVKLHLGVSMKEVQSKASEVLKRRQENAELMRGRSLEDMISKTPLGKARWENKNTPVNRKRIIRAADSDNFECVVQTDSKVSNDGSSISVRYHKESKSFHDFTVTDVSPCQVHDGRNVQLLSTTPLVDGTQDSICNSQREARHEEVSTSAPFSLRVKKVAKRKISKEEPVRTSPLRKDSDENRCKSATPGSTADYSNMKANSNLFKIDVVRVAKWRSIPIYKGELITQEKPVQRTEGIISKLKNEGHHCNGKKMPSATCVFETSAEIEEKSNVSNFSTKDMTLNENSKLTSDFVGSAGDGSSNPVRDANSEDARQIATNADTNTSSTGLKALCRTKVALQDNVKTLFGEGKVNHEPCPRDQKLKVPTLKAAKKLIGLHAGSVSKEQSKGIVGCSSVQPSNIRGLSNGMPRGKLTRLSAQEDEVKRKLAEIKERRLLKKRIGKEWQNKNASCEKNPRHVAVNDAPACDVRTEISIGRGAKETSAPVLHQLVSDSVKASSSAKSLRLLDYGVDESAQHCKEAESVPDSSIPSAQNMSGSRTVQVPVEDKPGSEFCKNSLSSTSKSAELANAQPIENPGISPTDQRDSSTLQKSLHFSSDVSEDVSTSKLCLQQVTNSDSGSIAQRRITPIDVCVKESKTCVEQANSKLKASKQEREGKANVADRFLSKIGTKKGKLTSYDVGISGGHSNDSKLRNGVKSRVMCTASKDERGGEKNSKVSASQMETTATILQKEASERLGCLTDHFVADIALTDSFEEVFDEPGETPLPLSCETTSSLPQSREERRRRREDSHKRELNKHERNLEQIEKRGDISMRERTFGSDRRRRVIVVDNPNELNHANEEMSKAILPRSPRVSHSSRSPLASIEES